MAIELAVVLGVAFAAGGALVLIVMRQARNARRLVAQAQAAEAKAERSRAQLDDAIKSISQAVILYDADERVVLFNEHCIDCFPESRDLMFIGQDFETLLRALVERHAIDLGDRTPEEFIQWRLEQHRSADGTPLQGRLKDGRHVHIAKSKTHEGGVVTVTTDITDVVEREKACRESEERYRRLVELSPDGIYVNCDNRFAFVNPAAVSALGAASPEALLGRPILDIVHPDDREDGAARNGQVRLERRYVGLDGREFDVEVSGTPITHDDKPAVLTIFRDVTERKRAELALRESERRVRDFAEASADWFWETDSDLRFTYLSANVERIVGVPPEHHYGKTRGDFLGEGYDQKLWGEHLKALERRQPFRDFIYPTEEPGMPRRWIRVSGLPRFSDQGVFLGYRGSASDVTVQVETEKSLKELDEQVRIIADHAPLLIAYVTAEGRYGFVNETAESWFGRSAADIQGKRRDEILPSHCLKRLAPHVDAALAGEATRFEESIAFADGVVRWIEGVNVPHQDKDGRVLGYFALIQDVTERKRAETEASEARQTLAEALQSTDHGIAVCDKDDRLIIWNDAFTDLNFRIRERLRVGANFEDLIRAAAESGQVVNALGREEAWIAERLRVRGGTDVRVQQLTNGRWFSVTERRMPSGGMVGVWTDVTELKAREAELEANETQIRLITDNLPVSIAYADAGLHFRFVNRTAARWMEMPVEEIVGSGLPELIDPQRYLKIKPYLERALAGEQVHFQDRQTYPDGVERFVRATYIPHIDEAGQVCGIFGLVLDATDQHRAEELLIQAQKMEAVGQLTGGIAHDFNNLLLAILGNLELLEERVGDDEKARRYLGTALRATHRGADLTQRLLAFSRKQALHPAVVDVNELVRGMLDLLQGALGGAVEMRTRLSERRPMAMIDAHQLENALLNLALNARDALPDGGSFTLETRSVELEADYFADQESVEPGDYVLVSVSDSGGGMRPEVLERAFDPFFTTKDVGAGSGLGLSMVYGFVKQSGGHVTIYSEPGAGTSVKLFLPDAKAEARETAAAAPAESRIPCGNETVLLVEDDPAVRAYVKEALVGLGYEVVEAAHGREAVKLLRRVQHLDLLLTDLVLPMGMNGRQVADAVRLKFPEVKCLFASGYAEIGTAGLGRPDSPCAFLDKPFTRGILARRVRDLLDEEEREPAPRRETA